MRLLLDSGILLRLLDRSDANHAAIRQCLRRLRLRGDTAVVSAQNIAEFWNVCTRPASARRLRAYRCGDRAKGPPFRTALPGVDGRARCLHALENARGGTRRPRCTSPRCPPGLPHAGPWDYAHRYPERNRFRPLPGNCRSSSCRCALIKLKRCIDTYAVRGPVPSGRGWWCPKERKTYRFDFIVR